jgi:hypothetical protein
MPTRSALRISLGNGRRKNADRKSTSTGSKPHRRRNTGSKPHRRRNTGSKPHRRRNTGSKPHRRTGPSRKRTRRKASRHILAPNRNRKSTLPLPHDYYALHGNDAIDRVVCFDGVCKRLVLTRNPTSGTFIPQWQNVK